MEISVAMGGKQLAIDGLQAETTVAELKRKCEDATGILARRIKLIFKVLIGRWCVGVC